MDNQLALMKKLQKAPDTIAYAHNEEIVLIKRVVGDDGTRLLEVMLNSECKYRPGCPNCTAYSPT